MAKKRKPHPESRRFLRASRKRLQEASFLLENGFTTAAVYLGGYAVECAIKSLILSSEPRARNRATLASFRGQRAHSLEWLRHELLERRVLLPDEIVRDLTIFGLWATDLRYDPKDIAVPSANRFLELATALFHWTHRRKQT